MSQEINDTLKDGIIDELKKISNSFYMQALSVSEKHPVLASFVDFKSLMKLYIDLVEKHLEEGKEEGQVVLTQDNINAINERLVAIFFSSPLIITKL